MDAVVFLFIIGLAIFVYLLPAFVALQRKNVNTTAICVLNILTGWCFFGWVAALVWALVKSGDKK
nr:MAG: Superinfection immunity protein [Bacteriophage sp.]